MTTPKILAFSCRNSTASRRTTHWWGEGFTEWTNVRKARPNFLGHYQPHVPRELGYYDLLDPAAQSAQAALARAHGMQASATTTTGSPAAACSSSRSRRCSASGAPDFPFCLCWANENWTRRWDGGDSDVLMPQAYGGRRRLGAALPISRARLLDPRYIRVDGKPMLLIYRTAGIVECSAMLDCWRNLAVQSGLAGLHIVSMLTFFGGDGRSELFDAQVEFERFYTMTQCPST